MRVFIIYFSILGFALPAFAEHDPAQTGRATDEGSRKTTVKISQQDLEAWKKPVKVDQDSYERTFLHYKHLQAKPAEGLSPSATIVSLEFQSRLLERGADPTLVRDIGANFEAALRDRSAMNSGGTFQRQLEDAISVVSLLPSKKIDANALKIMGREFNHLTEAGGKQLALEVFVQVMGITPGRMDAYPMTASDIEMLKSMIDRAAKNPKVRDGLESTFKKVMGVGQTDPMFMLRGHNEYSAFAELWAKQYAPSMEDMSLDKAVGAARHSADPASLKRLSAAADKLAKAYEAEAKHLGVEAASREKEKLRSEIRQTFADSQAGAQIFSAIANQIDPEAGKAFTITSRATLDIAEVLAQQLAGNITKDMAGLNIAGIAANLLGAILGGPSPEQMILEQLAELRREVSLLHNDMLKEFGGVHLHLNALERHLDGKFIELDRLIRSTHTSLAGLDGKLDLHHAEVRKAFGDQRASELDTLLRKCPNRSSQVPMDTAYFAGCLDELMNCAVTQSRDSIATGSKLIFEEEKSPKIERVLQEAASSLKYGDNWGGLNFLSGTARYLGRPLSPQSLPNPALWAMCSQGYLQMMSRWPSHYKKYDPDLRNLKELHQAGNDLRKGLEAIAGGAEDKLDGEFLSRLLHEYRGATSRLETHVEGIRAQYEKATLNGYDMRLDGRQKVLSPIPFDREGGVPSIKACAGSWAERSEFPTLVGDPSEAFRPFIPNAVLIANEIFPGKDKQRIQFCYDISEFGIEEREFEPHAPFFSQTYVKTIKLTIRASFDGEPIFVRSIEAPFVLQQRGRREDERGLHEFTLKNGVKQFLGPIWTATDGMIVRFVKESLPSHLRNEYAFLDSGNKPAPFPHGLRRQDSDVASYWWKSTLPYEIEAQRAVQATGVRAASAVREAFKEGRKKQNELIKNEIKEGSGDTGRLVKEMLGARALLRAYLQLGLPQAVRDDKDFHKALMALPDPNDLALPASPARFFQNEVDRRITDPNNPTYPKEAAPIPEFPNNFLGGVFKTFAQAAASPARPPADALELDRGELRGDPDAPQIPEKTYADYYQAGPTFFTEVENQTADLETQLKRVLGASPAKGLELRRHSVVDDSLSEVLKALVAKERGLPYKFSK